MNKEFIYEDIKYIPITEEMLVKQICDYLLVEYKGTRTFDLTWDLTEENLSERCGYNCSMIVGTVDFFGSTILCIGGSGYFTHTLHVDALSEEEHKKEFVGMLVDEIFHDAFEEDTQFYMSVETGMVI